MTSASDDVTMPDCTVDGFRDILAAAAYAVDVVEPPHLRSALKLWFLATAERARIESWTSLLGRSVVAVWSAAVAVLAEAEQRRSRVVAGE